MGMFDNIFKRPANFVGNVSREAFPVKRESVALSGLSKLVGKEYIARLENSLKYKGFAETMADRKKWLGIYTGSDTNSHLVSKFTASTLEEVILADTNIVDRAIRRMALIYKDSPEYNYAGDIPKDYPSAKRWIALKNAERLCNLLGTIAVRPVVRAGVMQWDVLWYFVPLISASDGLELDGIAYPLSAEANPKLWAVWTEKEMYIANTETQTKEPFPDREDMVNPYKRVPFTLVHPKYPIDNCPLVNGYGAMLTNANDNLILGMTEAAIGVRFNLMGQFFTTGLDKKNKISVGTNHFPNLPTGATFDNIAPTGNFDAAILYFKYLTEAALQNVGISVQWGEDGGAPSGISLEIKNLELIERREDDVPIWREGDQSIYEDEVAIAEQDLKHDLPELEGINFAEMSFPKPASENRDQADWDFERGFDTEAAYLMRSDPDRFKNEDEAQKFIDENKQAAPLTPENIDVFGDESVTA